uniref:Uncharacterized protein n=1 Tax=Anguilla anguilla TaxID=7936 RepID=A0A0E9XSZ9_ANGAN
MDLKGFLQLIRNDLNHICTAPTWKIHISHTVHQKPPYMDQMEKKIQWSLIYTFYRCPVCYVCSPGSVENATEMGGIYI